MGNKPLTAEERALYKGIFADWETMEEHVPDIREVRVRPNSGGRYQPADPRINLPGTVTVTGVPAAVSVAELCNKLDQCVVRRRPLSADFYNQAQAGTIVVSYPEIKPGAIIRWGKS